MTSTISTLTKFSVRSSLAAALMIAGTSWLSASAQPLQQSTAPSNSPSETSETPVQVPSTETDQAETNTAHYADEKISVNYPATWQIKTLDDGILISSDAATPAELVATQIVRMAAPPGAVVNANIESFTKEGSAVARYSRATIDGHDALVMWLADRPDELSSAIATFIGYDNETILLFSRYAPENTAAEADILQIHTSFTDPAATATAAPTEDSAAPNSTADTLTEAAPTEADSTESEPTESEPTESEPTEPSTAEPTTSELKPIENTEGEVIVPANDLSDK